MPGARLRAQIGNWVPPISANFARKLLVFLFNFGLARILIYFAPLALAIYTSADVYGAIEFSQPASLLGVSLLIGAPLAGVSQAYLIRREPLSVDIVAAGVIMSCTLAIAGAAVASAFGADALAVLTLLALGVAAQHNSISAVFRTLSRRNITAWTDGFAIIATVLIVAVAVALTGRATIEGLTLGYGAVSATGIVVGMLLVVRTRQPYFRARLMATWRFGAPVVVTSSFAVWQGAAGRILAGLFTASSLPAYGIAFRLAGLSFGLHQLAATALFARMYAGRTRPTDRLLALLLVGAAVILLLVIGAAQLMVGPDTFDALDAERFELYQQVLPIVALQLLFWIGNAMLELRITRFGVARRTFLPSVIINGSGIAILLVAQRFVPIALPAICWVVAAQSAAFFFVASWLLHRRGVPHPKLAVVGATGGAILAIVALL